MKRGCFITTVLVLVIAATAAAWWVSALRHRPTEYMIEPVDVGEVERKITAIGALSSLTTVNVGCEVSGKIASITVDFNDTVKAGQLLAEIDPSVIQAQVVQTTANLENVRAGERQIVTQIANLKSSLKMAQADLRIQQANLKKAQFARDDAERIYKRTHSLLERRLVATSEADSAQYALDSARVAVEAMEAQVAATEAKIESVRIQIEGVQAQHDGSLAQVRQMEAQLEMAKINLQRTRIFSPIDGVVVARLVDVGQTVAASFQTPTLFSIAQDLRRMQIKTSVGESDINVVKPGQAVTFSVDAQPGREFKATVSQVRLWSTTSQGVVTYPVIIDVDNSDLSLKPGMTVSVTILVDRREKVKRMPSLAMYFQPPIESGLTLPNEAIGEVASSVAWVWVLSATKVPEPRRLSIGLSGIDFTEVTSGDVASGTNLIIGVDSNKGRWQNRVSRPRRTAPASAPVPLADVASSTAPCVATTAVSVASPTGVGAGS